MTVTAKDKKKGASSTPAKPPTDESVLARARRMSKQETQKRLGAWASKLGVEGVESLEDFEGALATLATSRRADLSETEQLKAQIGDLQAQLQTASVDTEKYKSAYNKAERERKREVQRRKDDSAEREIMDAARGAAFRDPKYGMHLFREHVVGEGEHSNNPLAFFESLKNDPVQKHLFGQEAVAAGPGSPASQQPGDEGLDDDVVADDDTQDADVAASGSPPPAKPGKAGGTEDYDAMGDDKRSFNDRTAQKYGFRPNM